MKLTNVTVVSVFALITIAATGCSAKANDDDTLDTDAAELVEDDGEADGLDQDAESGIDDALSGATDADPGSPPEVTSDDELMGRVRSNPGRFFKPAGCITTTVVGNVATHVLKGCTGPYGMTSFDGTVVSTYVREAGKLTITHETEGFGINGGTLSGKRVIVYERQGTVISKHRTGHFSGTTAKGKPVSHEAAFTAAYDASTQCLTRSGSASTTVGTREHSRSLTDYKRCGIGRFGCPVSGTLVLTREKGEQSAKVTIQFLGGPSYTITGPRGRTVERKLLCRAS